MTVISDVLVNVLTPDVATNQQPPTPPRKQRSDDDYVIEALAKGLKVLEALEGSRFEPVPIQRVVERAKYPYDYCFRALKTFKVLGYAQETPRGWQLGPKVLRFADRFGEIVMAAMPANLEISELGNGTHTDSKALN